VAGAGTAGEYQATWQAPVTSEALTLNVTASHNTELVVVGVMQAVQIVQQQISLDMSTLKCPPSLADDGKYEAGTVVVCTADIYDLSGELVKEQALAQAFTAEVSNGAAHLSSDVGDISISTTNVAGGVIFKFSFAPEIADDAVLSVFYWNGESLSQVGQGTAVSVAPSRVSVQRSTLQCTASFTAGDPVGSKCVLHAYDQYGNVAAGANDSPDFTLQASEVGSLELVAQVGTAWEYREPEGLGQASYFQASVTMEKSGQWTLTALHHQDEMEENFAVEVLADTISAAHSSMECPAKTSSSAQVSCTIKARDVYLNPSSLPSGTESADATSSFNVIADTFSALDNVRQVLYLAVVATETVGTFETVSITAPLSGHVNMTAQHAQQTADAGSQWTLLGGGNPAQISVLRSKLIWINRTSAAADHNSNMSSLASP